jgi:hypothetical protein
VTLEAQKALPFSSIFMTSAPTIRATATAASIPGAAEYCVVALDSSASSVGIEIQGSTTLDMGDCSLIANSKNQTQAATNTGIGSSVIAHSLAAAGGVQYSSSWDVDSYDPYSTAVADPFAGKTTPPCTKTMLDNNNYVNSGANATPSYNKLDGSVSINRETGTTVSGTTYGKDVAGDVVCIKNTQNGKTGLSIASNSTVVLGPATYVIDGGDLSMSSNTTGTSLSCNGCTIILTNSTSTVVGNIKLTGGTLNLVAPSASTSTTAAYDMKGIVLMQDSKAVDSKPTQPANTINGNNGTSITGAVYIPSQALKYSGSSSTNPTAACLQIVAKRATFTGNSKITASSQCATAGLSPIGTGSSNSRKVRLVA